MIQYLQSNTKKVTGDFVIESFKQKKVEKEMAGVQVFNSLNLGIYIIAPLLIGLGIGLFVDSKLGLKSIGTVCGLLVGIIASFYNLIKIVQQFSKHA